MRHHNYSNSFSLVPHRVTDVHRNSRLDATKVTQTWDVAEQADESQACNKFGTIWMQKQVSQELIL
jgi:hypothetical protein